MAARRRAEIAVPGFPLSRQRPPCASPAGACGCTRRTPNRALSAPGIHTWNNGRPALQADAKAKGVKFGRKPKLTPHQQREAIRRRDVGGETLRSIGRSYNVSAQTISRLTPW
jgi:Helix-turn-helix domain of resolvase